MSEKGDTGAGLYDVHILIVSNSYTKRYLRFSLNNYMVPVYDLILDLFLIT